MSLLVGCAAAVVDYHLSSISARYFLSALRGIVDWGLRIVDWTMDEAKGIVGAT